MNIGKIVGIAASVAIFGAMGYLAMNESGPVQKKSFEVDQTPAADTAKDTAQKTPALSEEEQKVKDLKDSSREFAVSNLYILKCAPCHGDNGKGVLGPQLTGKSEQDILKKLYDYKEGRVKNSMMAGLLTNSTNEELKLLSSEIAKFGK